MCPVGCENASWIGQMRSVPALSRSGGSCKSYGTLHEVGELSDTLAEGTTANMQVLNDKPI